MAHGRRDDDINTFTDFIACAEYLINQKYTSGPSGHRGGSGGLPMGAVAL